MTDKKKTLTDGDITTRRGIGRRSFILGTFGGAAAVSACVPVTTGITDSDGGVYADPVGNGRGNVQRVSGITDSDSGPYADPVGNGRGRTGLTDSDGGIYADPAGRGRRGY